MLRDRREIELGRKEQAVSLADQRRASKIPGSITFTDYDSVHDLIADTSADQHIRRLSPYAWVAVGEDKFILSTNSGHYIMIEPVTTEEISFRAKYYWKLPAGKRVKSPYGTPRTIADGASFEHVVHAADTFASETFEHMWISKMQSWRRSVASQAQVDFLNKFRPSEDRLRPEDLTKGKAGDMITRIKHGARGRYDKATVKQRTAVRMKERAETMRSKLQGQVRVGPLSQNNQSIKEALLKSSSI